MSERIEPPRGVYLQLYRDAIRSAVRTETLQRYCDALAEMRTRGLVQAPVFHGFPEELADAWEGLAAMANARGMLALAGWGLDSNALTGERKGALVGDVLARRDCAGGLLDAEAAWDKDDGRRDGTDEAGARDLCDALTARAPGAWVGDQPWYAILAHGDPRRPAKGPREGGVFRGFPVDEFAAVTTWGRFRQAYIYNRRGITYAPTFARMDREWAALNTTLRDAGLERPLRITLQAYGWKCHELVHALLDRCVRPADPLILWCDPWPDRVTREALRFVEMLMRDGFAGPGIDARDAVRAWQTDYNRTAPERAKVRVDGIAGAGSFTAAGIREV